MGRGTLLELRACALEYVGRPLAVLGRSVQLYDVCRWGTARPSSPRQSLGHATEIPCPLPRCCDLQLPLHAEENGYVLREFKAQG